MRGPNVSPTAFATSNAIIAPPIAVSTQSLPAASRVNKLESYPETGTHPWTSPTGQGDVHRRPDRRRIRVRDGLRALSDGELPGANEPQ